MLKIIGMIIILISSYVYGNSLCDQLESRLKISLELLDLTMFIKASIKTARTPLLLIYEEFTATALEENGFCRLLREKGLSEAIDRISSNISKNTLNVMLFLSKNIGGINITDQEELCKYTEKILSDEIDKAKEAVLKKKKIYRLLPFLAGLSAIILLI